MLREWKEWTREWTRELWHLLPVLLQLSPSLCASARSTVKQGKQIINLLAGQMWSWMTMLCTRCVLFPGHAVSVSAAAPCAMVKGFCPCSIAAEAQGPQLFAGKVSCRAKNTPLASEASSLSMMLCRNVLQVFIRHLAVQEVGGLPTCYMCTADDKQSARKKKRIFHEIHRQIWLEIAQGKKSNHS